VLFVACVLYRAALLAAAGLYCPKWTDKIHEEWITNLLEERPELKPENLHRTKELMNKAVLDCVIKGYEQLIPGLKVTRSIDRHVLAAAIHSHCDAIITFNLKDFPPEIVGPYDIEVQHPDDFFTSPIRIG
jgi:hypothetical protein